MPYQAQAPSPFFVARINNGLRKFLAQPVNANRRARDFEVFKVGLDAQILRDYTIGFFPFSEPSDSLRQFSAEVFNPNQTLLRFPMTEGH